MDLTIAPRNAPAAPLDAARPPQGWSVEWHSLSPHQSPEFWRDWRALALKAPPFLRPDFLALEAPLVGGEHRVIAAYWNEILAAVLPVVRKGRRLEWYGSEHAPEYDFVGDPEAVPAIWRALVDDRGWDTLELSKIPSASSLVARLPSLALRDLCVTSVRPAARSPYLPLPGHERRLPPKLRQNLRRWTRKLGGVELERPVSISRTQLEDALTLEALAWKGAAGTSISSSAELRHFYEALARLSARRGELDLYFLRAAERRIAFLFALEDRHVLYALKMGYDPEFADFGPGHLLFSQVARDAERRGLLELDFLGKDDEWKRRWTELTRDHVTMVIYRPTPRGTATLVAREVIKPRLPETWEARLAGLRDEVARHRRACQRNDLVGVHTTRERVVGRLRDGLGIKSGVRHVMAARQRPPRRVGEPSRFRDGQWVRVLDAERLRATLDKDGKLRGLAFVPGQWSSCGGVYRVHKPVRRLVDDHGQLRAVSRTVLLEGVTCDGLGEGLGCGRHCPLMFRDEWLEDVSSPLETAEESPVPRRARVRSLAEIEATLDRQRRRDGVSFMPEMARHAGKRFAVVRQLERVYELDSWTPTQGPVYLLEGTYCRGEALGDEGPCDRACALLWHGDWLELETASS